MGNPKGVGRAPRNRVGERYGNLVAIKQAGANKNHQALWECKCDCGNTVIKSSVFFNSGGRQCSRKCPLGVHVKHGNTTTTTRTKEYAAWVDMKRRCYNPNSNNYKDYGGRGIVVCPQWVTDFPQFLRDVGHAPEGNRMSIDRIDNEGNYEPNNVRWATPLQQVMNRRNTKNLTTLQCKEGD